jgi:prophage antirepressor-like protein
LVCLADILRAIDTSTPPHVAKASLSEVFGDGGIAVTPIPDALGRIQESTIISEPAMTYLVAQSRTETANV